MRFLDLGWQYQQIPHFSDKLIELAQSGAYILSDELKNFEKKWAHYLGLRKCVGVNSGTDALSLALRTIGIQEGDKVLVQTNTFAATVYAIIQNQGIPLFVDINPTYGCIDIEALKETIIREKPKAIIPVHLYGQACFAEELEQISRENNLKVIEDCAQAHGALWQNKKAGTFSDISCFSFFPSKNLGALGDAGAVCSDNEEYIDKISQFRNVGSKVKNVHEAEWGGNSRLDNLQALVLSLKLDYLDAWNDRRRTIAETYRKHLHRTPLIMYTEHQDAYNVYHQFVIMVNNRQKIMEFLKKHNIPTLIHYPVPCHKASAFKKFATRNLPVAEWIAEHHLSLPMSPHLTEKDVLFVCDKLNEVLRNEQKPVFN